MIKSWTLTSWKEMVNSQPFTYKDHALFDFALKTLEQLPPLIKKQNIKLLSQELQEVAQGEKFILHVGDCAESFDNCHTSYIFPQLNLFKKLGKLLRGKLDKNICHIGRIGGQYAKPRTKPIEIYNNKEYVSYFGDIINNAAYNQISRSPDPIRMISGYIHTQRTMDLIADWQDKHHVSIFTSHESLLLPYEQALTRQYQSEWFNTSCHLPWIGMRTLSLNSAHVEYARGIQNPVAIKLGSDINEDSIRLIINKLISNRIETPLIIIYRFGVDRIQQQLPKLLSFLKRSKFNSLLCCDPMHGNTKFNLRGDKTRYIEDITNEIKAAIDIHIKFDCILNGLHLELSADDIYECEEKNFSALRKYKSPVDPRLNEKQALLLINSLPFEKLNIISKPDLSRDVIP